MGFFYGNARTTYNIVRGAIHLTKKKKKCFINYQINWSIIIIDQHIIIDSVQSTEPVDYYQTNKINSY